VAESTRRGEDAAEHVADVFDDAIDDDAVLESKRAVVKERVSRADKGEKIGLFGRIGRFVREIIPELRKGIWPTRNELLTYTAVVIVFGSVMVTVVGLLDLAYAQGVLVVFGNPK